jgi:hypothetical protein
LGGDCFGCGVCNDGYFEMSGNGMITNNNAASGGGVHNTGSFKLIGGVIANNFGGMGGGVCNEGFFELTNGMITNNTTYDGGGVYIRYGGSFKMTGGVITNNTAASFNGVNGVGGGVYVGGEWYDEEAGVFEMLGARFLITLPQTIMAAYTTWARLTKLAEQSQKTKQTANTLINNNVATTCAIVE